MKYLLFILSTIFLTSCQPSAPSGTEEAIDKVKNCFGDDCVVSKAAPVPTPAPTSVSPSAPVPDSIPERPPLPNNSAITLPIEVFSYNTQPEIKTVSFTISSVAAAANLWVKAYGLEDYTNKASVRLNNGNWVTLNNQTAQVLKAARFYDGFGGMGFETFSFQLPISALGGIKNGENSVSFRFNGPDPRGISMGFRVLAFNVKTSNGSNLLPVSAFTQDSPDSWVAPDSSAASIERGKVLFNTAVLTHSPVRPTQILAAKCMDCHFKDGSDLKYFNFSNNAIIKRSQFHGLSEQQGKDIASYVRTRVLKGLGDGQNIVDSARPWNPLYQPGPGMTTRPVREMAAGAGVDAVVDADSELSAWDHMFPDGINSQAAKDTFDTFGIVNVWDIPIGYQLPTWNKMLPDTHPKDLGGAATSVFNLRQPEQKFAQFEEMMNNPSEVSNKVATSKWRVEQAYVNPYVGNNGDFFVTFAQYVDGVVDENYLDPLDNFQELNFHKYLFLRLAEAHMRFDLEKYSQEIFGEKHRLHWFSYTWRVFGVASHMSTKEGFAGNTGIFPSAKAAVYQSNQWYHLAFILNSGAPNPMSAFNGLRDSNYHIALLDDLIPASGRTLPVTMLITQIMNGQRENFAFPLVNTQNGEMYFSGFWDPKNNDPGHMLYSQRSLLLEPLGRERFRDVIARFYEAYANRLWSHGNTHLVWPQSPDDSPTDRQLHRRSYRPTRQPYCQLSDSQFETWLTNNSHDYGLDQFDPSGYKVADGLYRALPRLRQLGVTGSIIVSLADWGQMLWPNVNWRAQIYCADSCQGNMPLCGM